MESPSPTPVAILGHVTIFVGRTIRVSFYLSCHPHNQVFIQDLPSSISMMLLGVSARQKGPYVSTYQYGTFGTAPDVWQLLNNWTSTPSAACIPTPTDEQGWRTGAASSMDGVSNASSFKNKTVFNQFFCIIFGWFITWEKCNTIIYSCLCGSLLSML